MGSFVPFLHFSMKRSQIRRRKSSHEYCLRKCVPCGLYICIEYTPINILLFNKKVHTILSALSGKNIDYNTDNTISSGGMYYLVHPKGWINDDMKEHARGHNLKKLNFLILFIFMAQITIFSPKIPICYH